LWRKFYDWLCQQLEIRRDDYEKIRGEYLASERRYKNNKIESGFIQIV